MTIKWNPEIWESAEKPKQTKTHCANGHLWTKKNTAFYARTGKRHKKGKKYRICKTCKADQWRLKYHSDPEFRARRIKRNTEIYFEKKASHGLGQVSGREQHSLRDTRTEHQEG